MPKIAIIILNWNQLDLTISTINSFLKIKHSGFDYQIILVTNIKIKTSAKVKTILNEQNLGYSGGNNLGIDYALKHKFDYVLIANNDIRVDLYFLQKLFDQIKTNPKLVLAPKIYFEKGYEFFKNKYKPQELGRVIWALGGKVDWQNIYGSNIAIDQVDTGQYDQNPPSPDFISGCCFLATSEFFRKVGLFDKKYYLYMEDVDLSIRAVKAGYKLGIIPQSKVWHINSGTAKAASNIQDYFITRNRLLFGITYAPIRTKLALIRESLKFLVTGRYWQKRGVIDFYLSNFEKGSWR